MRTFVIAQHHGVFFTLQSLVDCNIKNITLIIPGSQVQKYNKMWEENPNKKEYEIFKDFDKRIKTFIKDNNIDAEAFVFDDFEVRNTVAATLNAIRLYGYGGIATCIMAGTIVINDYTPYVKDALMLKEFGMCLARVYQVDRRLSMYHMIGLPQRDMTVDVNFFVVDMTKISSRQLEMNDSALLSDATQRKQLTHLAREYNGKDDVLIGTAISARQTILHGLKAKQGFIINLWNKSIKNYDLHVSEEILGYPFDIYGDYAEKMRQWIPESTASRMIKNGSDCKKYVGGLEECIEILHIE